MLPTTRLQPPRQRSRVLRREPLLRRMHAGLGRQLTLLPVARLQPEARPPPGGADQVEAA